MSDTETTTALASARPKRADALRNYEKLIGAARSAFAEDGVSTSLEDVARRAEVGIGTLYRHFPSRQALLEAVYLDELHAFCDSAPQAAELPSWEALIGWLRGFVAYLATKRALADELMSYIDSDAELFQACRTELYAAGGPLLERAQQAGVVRTDIDFTELIQMVGGIAKISGMDPLQIGNILDVALDGLRYTGASRVRAGSSAA